MIGFKWWRNRKHAPANVPGPDQIASGFDLIALSCLIDGYPWSEQRLAIAADEVISPERESTEAEIDQLAIEIWAAAERMVTRGEARRVDTCGGYGWQITERGKAASVLTLWPAMGLPGRPGLGTTTTKRTP